MDNTITITPEIRLTSFLPEDKTNLVRYLNDPEVARNTLTVPYPYLEKDADEWLAKVEELRQEYGVETNWAIRHNTEGLIGGIGRFVKTGLDGHADEIGYWLAAPFRGQGIMTAVVSRLCDWLFENTALIRIEAKVFWYNPASAQVLKKAGFDQEGYARKQQKKGDQFLDIILLAKIR